MTSNDFNTRTPRSTNAPQSGVLSNREIVTMVDRKRDRFPSPRGKRRCSA
ncbi:hypothetical protein [Mycobacterium sp.]